MMAASHSDPFVRIAARIDLNAEGDFAGAVCIVPPEGAPVELLFLDTTKDAGMFWALVKTKAEMALSELAERQSGGQWGGRR